MKQMHVVGHQHVGANGASAAPRLLGQLVEVAPGVLLGVKAHCAIVTALNDVPRDAGNAQAGAARHGETNELLFRWIIYSILA